VATGLLSQTLSSANDAMLNQTKPNSHQIDTYVS